MSTEASSIDCVSCGVYHLDDLQESPFVVTKTIVLQYEVEKDSTGTSIHHLRWPEINAGCRSYLFHSAVEMAREMIYESAQLLLIREALRPGSVSPDVIKTLREHLAYEGDA